MDKETQNLDKTPKMKIQPPNVNIQPANLTLDMDVKIPDSCTFEASSKKRRLPRETRHKKGVDLQQHQVAAATAKNQSTLRKHQNQKTSHKPT